jgi:hypothetical protein
MTPLNPEQPVAPTTTTQQDITTAGQRRINLIWEYTQACIAVIVVVTTMVAGLETVWTKSMDQVPNVICVAFGTVVGFYFSRTNHAAIGGVGRKPTPQEYDGR